MSAPSIQETYFALTDVKQIHIAKQDAFPQGFPMVINGKAVWSNQDFVNNKNYIYYMSDAELLEICQGLETFKGKWYTSSCTPCLTWYRHPLLSLSPPQVTVASASQPFSAIA